MTFPYWHIFIVKDLDNTIKWYKEESENLKYLKYLKLITVHIVSRYVNIQRHILNHTVIILLIIP